MVILAISTWIGKIWANIFIKEQELKYQKDIECYKNQLSEQLEILKANNEKVNHISKTQFDVEFKIYQELSEASFLMLLEVSQLFPSGLYREPEDKEKQIELHEKRNITAEQAFINFQNKLFQFAPFMSKEIYVLFDVLREQARLQVVWYPILILNENHNHPKTEEECWERTNKLTVMHKDIMESLRDYLSKLKVS